MPRSVADATAMLALVVAIALGGSQQYPLHAMLAELAAAAAIVATLAAPGRIRAGAMRPAWIAVAALVLVLAAQTLPLPYPVWAALPGRGLAAGILAAAGVAPAARPLSLDPYATVGTMLAVLPGLAMLIAGLTADRAMLRSLAACVVVGALAGALLGAAQISSGVGYLYADTHRGYAVGLFANRNHQVDMLLVAMLLVAAFRRGGRGAALAAAGVAIALAAGVIATGSRAGFVLLVPVLVAAAALATLRSRRGIAATLVAATAALAGLAALAAFNPAMGRLLARYASAGDDLRFTIWPNALFLLRQYWPAGTGLGTFVPLYQTVEPLDSVTRALVNHAHDDFLELLVELGAGGAVAIAAYLAALGWALVRAARQGGDWAAAAGIGIVAVLAHSLLDYPLRTPAMMAVFGLLNALLFRPATTRRRNPA